MKKLIPSRSGTGTERQDMTKTQVLALLKKNRNERGITHWEKAGHGAGGMKSFGIGLTVLR